MQRTSILSVFAVLAGLVVALLSVCCGRSSAVSSAPAADPISATFALAYPAKAEESEIRRAQDAVRTAPDQASAYARLARAFLARRRETGDARLNGYAQDALLAAQARDPRDPEVMTVAILDLHDRHQFRDARVAARELTRVLPSDATGHLLEGDAALELGDYQGAEAAFQRALDLSLDLRTYSRGGYLRWLHGDVDGALELMDMAIGSAGRKSRAPAAWCYVEVGEMLRRRGDYRRAAAAAERALALVGGYLPARALRARVLAVTGERASAIAEMEAVAAATGTAEHLLALADLYEAAGRSADAAKKLAEAEKLSSHDPLPVAAWLARRGAEPARALALAERAEADRPSVFASAVHALALVRAGRVEEGRAAAARAVRLGTPAAELYLARAVAESAAGDLAAAAAALAKARALEPAADPVLVAELDSKLGGR
jgi:tetratricopeptide (TPR) repeat protein